MTSARSATLAEAAATWLAGATAGSVRNRSGDVYKPSVVRGYEQALRLPELGAAQLSKIRRAELQALVVRLLVAATTLRRFATRCFPCAPSSVARWLAGRWP